MVNVYLCMFRNYTSVWLSVIYIKNYCCHQNLFVRFLSSYFVCDYKLIKLENWNMCCFDGHLGKTCRDTFGTQTMHINPGSVPS
jgi:hypothetical protein